MPRKQRTQYLMRVDGDFLHLIKAISGIRGVPMNQVVEEALAVYFRLALTDPDDVVRLNREYRESRAQKTVLCTHKAPRLSNSKALWSFVSQVLTS
jgi:hypothetical protein